MVLGKLDFDMWEKMKLDSYLSPCTKMNPK